MFIWEHRPRAVTFANSMKGVMFVCWVYYLNNFSITHSFTNEFKTMEEIDKIIEWQSAYFAMHN